MSEENRNVEFLNKVYENATMGGESISMLSEKVEDRDVLLELQRQHSEYTKIAGDTVQALAQEKAVPKKQSAISKMGLWSGVQMNTLTDRSSDKIAEMMIQGSTMGIIDLSRLMKEYSDIPDDYRKIAENLIKLEENGSQRMKQFLG